MNKLKITEWIFITCNTTDGITRWKLAVDSILFHIRETNQYFKQIPNHTPSTFLITLYNGEMGKMQHIPDWRVWENKTVSAQPWLDHVICHIKISSWFIRRYITNTNNAGTTYCEMVREIYYKLLNKQNGKGHSCALNKCTYHLRFE